MLPTVDKYSYRFGKNGYIFVYGVQKNLDSTTTAVACKH